MDSLLLRLVLRLALCLTVAAALWWGLETLWGLGSLGLALSAAVFAAALTKPLIELGGDLLHLLRRSAYADVEGVFYVYRGTRLHVVEDAGHVRWVRVADLQRVLGPGTSEATLARLYGERLQRLGLRRHAHLEAEALHTHLARDSRAEAGRFRLWLEREVVRPSKVLQGRVAPPPAPRPAGASSMPDPPASAAAARIEESGAAVGSDHGAADGPGAGKPPA